MATPVGPITAIKAVEQIVRSLPGDGDITVSALETGQATHAGVAETYLDQCIRAIQALNDYDFNLYRGESWTPAAVTRFTPAVLTGHAYTHATRLITEVGAFANYTWRRKDRYHIVSGTGVTADQWVEIQSKVSNDVIKLASVPAGASGNQTDWVTDAIGYQYGVEFDSNTLHIQRALETHDNLHLHGLYAFNRRTNDYDFGGATPILVDRRVQLGFDAMPVEVQDLIIKEASILYQRRRIGDASRDAMLGGEKVQTQAAIEAMNAPPQPGPRPPIVGSPFRAPQQQ